MKRFFAILMLAVAGCCAAPLANALTINELVESLNAADPDTNMFSTDGKDIIVTFNFKNFSANEMSELQTVFGSFDKKENQQKVASTFADEFIKGIAEEGSKNNTASVLESLGANFILKMLFPNHTITKVITPADIRNF